MCMRQRLLDRLAVVGTISARAEEPSWGADGWDYRRSLAVRDYLRSRGGTR